MEPMRSELPPEGYLEGVRDLANRYGVVLIFDEVSCGWRISLGGVQEFTGVTPDLTVFAKAISNGYPMGAVVGKREVMQAAAGMFISSAYWDDNVGISASIATLKELRRLDAPAYFEKIGADLMGRINEAARDAGLDAECAGVAAHPGIRFNIDDAELAKKVSTLFVQENARRGLILATGFFFNMAHDEEAVAATAAGVRETFEVIAGGLRSGDMDSLLEAGLQEDSFRRLVR
jgi:glutamate-1-semialdehyde aminotransferase